MAFGSRFANKQRKPEPVRPITGTLVRIVLLGVLAAGGAAEGIYLYYTHAFRPKIPAIPSATASAQPGTIEVEVQ